MSSSWPSNSRIPPSSQTLPSSRGNSQNASSGEAGSKRPHDKNSKSAAKSSASRKKKVKDRIISQQVIDLVPESQAYMDLLSFENKLDTTIMRKRLDIQEALKRPLKQKRKLRIFVSTNFYHPKPEEADDSNVFPQWEIRVEGKLIEDPSNKDQTGKQKRKFSSFFKNLVIELDRELYGPENHLVQWHRTSNTQETDGFQVKRPMIGTKEVKCSIFLMLDYQPPQFKLSEQLSKVLGVHTESRPKIITSLWQYVKNNKLQDSDEREYINNDKYLQEIFNCPRMKFCEIPQRLQAHLLPPDPIVINYIIDPAKPESKKPMCYDIEVHQDDNVRDLMQNFLLSTQSQQEISALESKIHETVEGINQLKTQRDFFLSYSTNPQKFMNDWLASQAKDLKTMTDSAGNAEEERRSDYYNQTWVQEAVHRYFYRQVQEKRAELEQALGIRSGS